MFVRHGLSYVYAKSFWILPLLVCRDCRALFHEGQFDDSEVGMVEHLEGPCDTALEKECGERLGCKWFDRKCSVRIAWLHIMKTGSTFGTTLAHHANFSLPGTAHVPSGTNESDPEDRIEDVAHKRKQQLCEDFFEMHYPISQWFEGVFRSPNPNNPGDHVPIKSAEELEEWKGSWVGMFREPADRVHSAWHYFAEGKGDMLRFARTISGQQASMLASGEDGLARAACEFGGGGELGHVSECTQLVSPNVTLALERLESFAFVGLLEEYDLSICLFHIMFRSRCQPVEFIDIRPSDEEDSEAAKNEIKLLQDQGDSVDTPVYDAAKRRFWRDVQKYGASKLACLETCGGSKRSENNGHANASMWGRLLNMTRS
eukprot:TRINITY_DN10726_c0_g2_i1.p1 TRINITY_DN10726_c0_g2~~TRINITY_DN10726_c0_g2_i1.p1  ORF type:complete len:373 (-),score=52.94 TRINITY_DN10726_c0_g2_i1:58-1176(-)